ncbi:MAG: hypothetical protein GQ474_09565 [Sulfurimonas sp.]|nr:hypothetical protein [Sulfurimonas sp.]
MKNSEIYDAVSEAVGKTIDHFLKDDPYYSIIPYLYDGEIDATCPFFEDNRITVSDTLSSEDLKTMSYLAQRYRSRVAYNPKNIDYYMRALGHIDYSQSAMDMVCFPKAECGQLANTIKFQEWLALPASEQCDYIISNTILVEPSVSNTVFNDLHKRHGEYKYLYPATLTTKVSVFGGMHSETRATIGVSIDAPKSEILAFTQIESFIYASQTVALEGEFEVEGFPSIFTETDYTYDVTNIATEFIA